MPPTDTPVPPVAESDPVAVVQAWVEALNSGDVDAALDLFTDDGKYLAFYTAYGKDQMRWVFNWLAGLDTKYEIVECVPNENRVSCTMRVVDGCIAAFGATDGFFAKMNFAAQQNSKITEVSGGLEDARANDYFGEFQSIATSWMRANYPEALIKVDAIQDENPREAGALQIKLCRDYETAVKTQEPATAAAAQGLVDSINAGDADAALALLTDDAKFRVWNDEAVGADQVRSMFDWLAGKETQYQITDCEWRGIGSQCAVSVVDGCIIASGVPDGVQSKMTFYSQEDGTLRNVVGVLSPAGRKAYETWLEAENVWASANRADELAQAEGYSKEAGAMAIKLCQEYAAAPKLDDATVAKIDAIVETAMTDYPTPGFEMCIVKDGQVVYNEGFGMADVEGGRAMTPRSVSIQASISKSLTAMAVMQLVEQGKIDLDTPVTTYLPYFTMADPRYEEITVRMLLSHHVRPA